MIYIMAAIMLALTVALALFAEYAETTPVYMNPDVSPVPECPPEYKVN